MRGRHDPQATMLAFVDLKERVPQDHPIRTIKIIADDALERLSPEFDQMYSMVGRASVPPERLLKASLLISLYSVRSERAFCEELEYNLLFRWFLDMNLMERSFDPTVPHLPPDAPAGCTPQIAAGAIPADTSGPGSPPPRSPPPPARGATVCPSVAACA